MLMAHTNRGRVILGGLLAGLVINLVEFVTNGLVLNSAWARVMQSIGKPPLTVSSIVLFNVWGFLLGIASVWLYAAIRPRYGVGPATAVRAGIAAWVMAVFFSTVVNYAFGVIPAGMLVITSLVELIEIPLATVVGAWVYKEEQAQTPAASRAAA
jgi:hypothetical protein